MYLWRILFLIYSVSVHASELLHTQPLTFYIRLTNVGYQNASFKLVDDNLTPINYVIAYDLNNSYQYFDKNGLLINEKDHRDNTIEIQTNSITGKETNVTSFIDPLFWDNGVELTNEEVKSMQGKSGLEQHTILVGGLDEGRVYEISFKVVGSLVQRKVFKGGQFFDAKRSVKNFQLQFRTGVDVRKAAVKACAENKKDAPNNDLKPSCYEIDSACTKCSPHCYQVKDFATIISNVKPTDPILCQRCPCDLSKSTGICTVSYQQQPEITSTTQNPAHADNMSTRPILKCSKCTKPFVGDQCNECEHEGFDYYKNKGGECKKCFCSGNARYDNSDFNSHVGDNLERKCEAITGKCVGCMFNTTGVNCGECLKGFHGDPGKRTCRPVKGIIKGGKSIPPDSHIIHLTPADIHKQQYNSKTFIFFYLCFLLSVAACVYLFVSKYKKTNYQDTFPFMRPCSSCCSFLSDSTRDHRYRLLSFCYAMWPKGFKGQHSPSRAMNVGCHEINDDDRLNLAEYQVYDENALFEADPNKRAEYTDAEDIMNSRKNPYRELTMKC